MPISERAGRPAEPSELVDVDRLVRRTTRSGPTRPIRPSGSRSGRPGIAARRSTARSTRRTSRPRPRRSAATARARGRTGRCSSVATRTPCPDPPSRRRSRSWPRTSVDVRVDAADGYTPTPRVSHAILVHNRGRRDHLADGIVVTPSHNPPEDGGFKYNPPNGGPADTDVTRWIQDEANRLLEADLAGVRRVPLERARRRDDALRLRRRPTSTTSRTVIDMDAIRGSGLRLGVDPLGGASVAYWPAIAERYGLDLTVTNDVVDPQFAFMTCDWDGRIRMDPSSPYAMASAGRAARPVRRRLRQRHRRRPPRDRHARRRPAEPEPLPVGGGRPPVRRRARLGAGRRRRQDAGLERDDRPRRRRTSGVACWRSRSGSSGSSPGSSTGRSGSVARRVPAPRSCAATARSGRPTRTASSPASSPPS